MFEWLQPVRSPTSARRGARVCLLHDLASDCRIPAWRCSSAVYRTTCIIVWLFHGHIVILYTFYMAVLTLCPVPRRSPVRLQDSWLAGRSTQWPAHHAVVVDRWTVSLSGFKYQGTKSELIYYGIIMIAPILFSWLSSSSSLLWIFITAQEHCLCNH